jgi:cyclic pyranopterin phosphate synthase
LSILNGSRDIVENSLVDGYGRIARKLRLSVTDRCNMQCIYCMPRDTSTSEEPGSHNQANPKGWLAQNEILSYEEFLRLTCIMARLGIEKIRVTGGEPLLRPKVEDLIAGLSKINKIKSISMTTNGQYLGEKAELLKKNGLQSVNISLDTFKPDRFKAMCGIDGLHKVLNSIRIADYVGLKIKINAVIVRGWNDDEVLDFARYARETGHVVRYIEFMPLDGSGIWSPDLVVSKNEIISRIRNYVGDLETVGMADSRNVETINSLSSPATLYSFADGKGVIGFIPSMTEPFCDRCDRIRITSDGRLLTCLFENPGHDIKKMLRSGKTDKDIVDFILQCNKKKPEGVVSIIRSKTLKPSLNLMHTIGG